MSAETAPRAARCRRLAPALLGVLALALSDAGRATDEIVAGGGDRLGGSRLFYSAAQRRVADAGGARRDSGRDETDDARARPTDPAAPVNTEPPGAHATATRGRTGSATSPATPSRTFYQALLRVGGRVQLIIDDRPCRIVAGARSPTRATDEAPVRCAVPPPEVRALALSVRDGRLLVTRSDGRRQRLDVGDALHP